MKRVSTSLHFKPASTGILHDHVVFLLATQRAAVVVDDASEFGE